MTGFPRSLRISVRAAIVIVLLVVSVTQTGCEGVYIAGGTNLDCNQGGSIPVPTITSVNPSSLDLGKQQLPTVITAYGKDFRSSSVVTLNSVPLKTDYVSSTMLQATLDTATWIAVGGSNNGFFIAVSTAGFPGGAYPKYCPNGGTSSNIVIIITG